MWSHKCCYAEVQEVSEFSVPIVLFLLWFQNFALKGECISGATQDCGNIYVFFFCPLHGNTHSALISRKISVAKTCRCLLNSRELLGSNPCFGRLNSKHSPHLLLRNIYVSNHVFLYVTFPKMLPTFTTDYQDDLDALFEEAIKEQREVLYKHHVTEVFFTFTVTLNGIWLYYSTIFRWKLFMQSCQQSEEFASYGNAAWSSWMKLA